MGHRLIPISAIAPGMIVLVDGNARSAGRYRVTYSNPCRGEPGWHWTGERAEGEGHGYDVRALLDTRVWIENPPEPGPRESVFYRGWECGYDADAAFWTKHGWRAYKGGVDIDVPTVDAASWPELLDEIDAEEDDA